MGDVHGTDVHDTGDPAEVLDAAGAFLLARPVEHNVILTLLHQRVVRPQPGRYWWAEAEGAVVGVAFQSPLDFSLALTPMPAPLASRFAAGVEPPVPGVIAEAATAATFAGAWTARHAVPGAPTDGERLYRLGELRAVATASGRLRPAGPHDRDRLVEWFRGFQADTGGHRGAPEEQASTALEDATVSVWEDTAAVAMAGAVPATGGVVRIGPVYTPPDRRARGYATACVEALSRSIVDAGHTAILYTQLANPTSNGIYRRIGYEPVLEVLRYELGAPGGLSS
jgi:GNAT superfamily N-acetyltransferase